MMTSRTLYLIALFTLASAVHGSAVTTLWTKTLTPETEFRYMVGSDGTVAVVDAERDNIRKIYWIDRSGEVLHEIEPPSADSPYSPIYVTRDELILTGGGMSLYQEVAFDQVDHTFVQQGLSAFASKEPLSYPYLIVAKAGEDGATEFTLLDLTNSDAMKVVGDAVIGIHGKNLKVRWKSVVNTKYKVQVSTDLSAWTDYTEVMDGTGATIIVNVPLDEDSDELYARVVKL